MHFLSTATSFLSKGTKLASQSGRGLVFQVTSPVAGSSKVNMSWLPFSWSQSMIGFMRSLRPRAGSGFSLQFKLPLGAMAQKEWNLVGKLGGKTAQKKWNAHSCQKVPQWKAHSPCAKDCTRKQETAQKEWNAHSLQKAPQWNAHKSKRFTCTSSQECVSKTHQNQWSTHIVLKGFHGEMCICPQESNALLPKTVCQHVTGCKEKRNLSFPMQRKLHLFTSQ